MSAWDDYEEYYFSHIMPRWLERLEKDSELMTQKRDTVYLHGKIYWAKIFGAPRTKYNEDGREWALEFEPDDEGVEVIKSHKLKDRLKDKYKKDGTVRKGYENRDRLFLNLKRNEFDYQGEPNEHIRVVDAANQKWNPKEELGNETEVDMKLQIVNYGPGKKSGIYPIAIRVLDLVPFERNDFAPLPEDDERVKEAKSKRGSSFEKDFGLEEEGDTPEMAPEEAPKPENDLDDDMPA